MAHYLSQGDATIYGESGADELYVDGRAEGAGRNTMTGTNLNWNGGDGEDRVHMQFVSAGTTNLNLFGDSDGPNSVFLHCVEVSCNREWCSLPR